MNPAATNTFPHFSAVATWLGRAGLLPFLALPLLLAWDTRPDAAWAHVLAAYSFGILCFLVGAWWGLSLARQQRSPLLLSNGVFLLLFFGYLALPLRGYLWLAAVLFIALLVVERRHPLFQQQPTYYANLRLMLSVTASLSLICAAVLAPVLQP